MQKGEQKKLNLLLSGISSRLEKNIDYFCLIDCKFISGKKTFNAQIKLKDKKYLLKFQGVSKNLSTNEIIEFLFENTCKYDKAEIIYEERGTVITITSDLKGISMKQSEPKSKPPEKNPLLQNEREYLIQIDKASKLLKEIGILTKDGKLKNDMIRKYNQIDHYVELVSPMFKNDKTEEIILLDCACGKSYLSFVMNYYIRDVLHRKCKVIGIDINDHVIKESQKMADNLGYHNMEFIKADLKTYIPHKNITAVISLHACDTATDLALATAVKAKAKYIACVPCCHKELLSQYKFNEIAPLTKHGVFKARFNDVLTDSLRTLKLEAEGYRVSVVEYVSPLDTPKNLLIRAAYSGQKNKYAQNEYEKIRKFLNTYSELDKQLETQNYIS